MPTSNQTTGDYVAEEMYWQALAVAGNSGVPDDGRGVHDGPHPDIAVALHNQALIMKEAGRLAEADSLFRRSMAVQDAVFEPDHPNRAFRRVGLGM